MEIGRQIKALKRHGLKAEELDFAKRNVRGGILLGLESTNNRMANLSRQIMYGKPDETVDAILARLDKVTPEDIRRCIADIFDSGKWASAAVTPKNAKVSMGGLLDF